MKLKLRKDNPVVEFGYMCSKRTIPDSVSIWVLFWRLIAYSIVFLVMIPIVIYCIVYGDVQLFWDRHLAQRWNNLKIFPTIKLVDNDDVENDMED